MALQNLHATFGLLANITFSVVLVFLNKYIYTHIEFPNVTLTCIHFLISSVCMELVRRLDVFQVKTLPIKDMVELSISFSGFVVLTNLSLQENTVGTSQLSKFLTTPCIVLIQTLVFGKEYRPRVLLTLIPMCFGVVINNYNDVKLNRLGSIYALSGVLVTSIYQALVESKQHKLQANSLQLLYYQAPLSCLFLFAYLLKYEPIFQDGGLFGTLWSPYTMAFILLSAFVGFLMNLSTFFVIGKTSPLTYNMAGQVKFCLVVLGGFIVYNEIPSITQTIGILSTLTGVGTYTYLKLSETSDEKAQGKSN